LRIVRFAAAVPGLRLASGIVAHAAPSTRAAELESAGHRRD